jgi:serine/threonine protein kinase
MLNSGDKLGDWIVVAPLGEGSMGAVFRCRHRLSPHLSAAVKVLKPSVLADARARFLREAGAMARLDHPAIVRLSDVGEAPERGLLYLVMELVEGETLSARLRRGPLSRAEARDLFTQLADGLAHAHRQGVFHRDIKPGNVMLCADGGVRLLDFGVALEQDSTRLTTDDTVPGTLSFMPPELFQGEAIDYGRMDVYALGLMLFEALSGQRAFDDATDLPSGPRLARMIAMKLQQGAFDPGAQLPADLRALVRHAAAPASADRLADMDRFAAALRRARPELEAPAGPWQVLRTAALAASAAVITTATVSALLTLGQLAG